VPPDSGWTAASCAELSALQAATTAATRQPDQQQAPGHLGRRGEHDEHAGAEHRAQADRDGVGRAEPPVERVVRHAARLAPAGERAVHPHPPGDGRRHVVHHRRVMSADDDATTSCGAPS
jgi:hypothetical protein